MSEQKQQPASQEEARNSDHHPGVTPSGPRGDNPGTAGSGKTTVKSNTPENNEGHINPSAPEDSNTTPGTTGKK